MPETHEVQQGIQMLINHMGQLCAPAYVTRKMLIDHCDALVDNNIAPSETVIRCLILMVVPDEV